MGKKLKFLILIFGVILAVALGIFAGLSNYSKKYDNVIYNGVTIKGVDVSGLTKEQAKEIISNKFNNNLLNKRIKLKYKDSIYSISFKTLKAHYDIDNAINEAFNYGKQGNAFEKALKIMGTKNENRNFDLKFSADTSIVNKKVKKIARYINIEPKNAKVFFEGGNFRVKNDIDGLRVVQNKLINDIKGFVNPNYDEHILNIPVEPVKAKIKASALTKITTKLSTFSTSFRLTDSNRVQNLKVASSYVNGTVVLPGEIFSMNKTLGQRTKAKGYEEAPVIIGNKHTSGLAGGICQVTTTVYNAALLAGFDIVQRTNHGLRVGYVEAGRDATISGDYKDMKFRNNTKNPIYIEMHKGTTTLTVNIFGYDEHPNRKIEIYSEIYQRIKSHNIDYEYDSSLRKGVRIVESSAKQGVRSRTYRKTFEDGKLIKTELISQDYYKPANEVIRIGTQEDSLN